MQKRCQPDGAKLAFICRGTGQDLNRNSQPDGCTTDEFVCSWPKFSGFARILYVLCSVKHLLRITPRAKCPCEPPPVSGASVATGLDRCPSRYTGPAARGPP